ncbi:MAG: hypothetical protein M0C28_20165 [Candidatus Moduliflexus flocculans]|nr:hypothetical protein [Candidatus Moduliflexus flocculans]
MAIGGREIPVREAPRRGVPVIPSITGWKSKPTLGQSGSGLDDRVKGVDDADPGLLSLAAALEQPGGRQRSQRAGRGRGDETAPAQRTSGAWSRSRCVSSSVLLALLPSRPRPAARRPSRC